jgi:hypothetical protein
MQSMPVFPEYVYRFFQTLLPIRTPQGLARNNRLYQINTYESTKYRQFKKENEAVLVVSGNPPTTLSAFVPFFLK